MARAKLLQPAAFQRVIGEIEWKLAQQPLPRLQRLGASTAPFLYEIRWDERVTRSRLNSPDADRRIYLLPNVAENLVLRPAILQRWAESGEQDKRS